MTRLSRFSPHMARLTETHEITPHIGLLRSSELAERNNVIYGQAVSNVLTAVAAVPTLLSNDHQADSLPVPSPVRLGPPNPVAGRGTRQGLGSMQRAARNTAICVGTAWPSGLTGLPLEANLAAQAGEARPQHSPLPRARGRLGVLTRGTARFVQHRCIDDGFTPDRTESTTPVFEPARWSGEQLPALLAGFRYRHEGSLLSPFAGSGTTLQAARDEGFWAFGIEREPSYLPLIAHRLGLDLPIQPVALIPSALPADSCSPTGA